MSENQHQQRLIELLAKKITGTLSEQEEQELLARLETDSGVRTFADQFSPELLASELALREATDTPAAWEQFREQAGFRKSLRWSYGRSMAVAASLLLIVTTGLYLYLQRNHQHNSSAEQNLIVKDIPRPEAKAVLKLADGRTVVLDKDNSGNEDVKDQGILNLDEKEMHYGGSAGNAVAFNTVSTPRGVTYKLVLPDGTGVWLNTSSSIQFPTAFAGNKREVTITGETYFEVAKDAAKPFIVHTNDMAVQVLGTQFNIEAWPGKAVVNTTLLQGSVSVERGDKKVKLKPGQQAIAAQQITVSSNADIDQVMAWKQGKFVFRATNIQDIMENLARYYDFEVQYQGTVTSSLFAGTFERNAPLSEILLFLEKTGGVRFRIEGRKVVVMP
ncbi:MAG: FecR domain-containing protein [Pseudobacter sp.]|uniref:FecR domain-containing protein n=1 Tax=Pseudobacter sp. TaxID=2045420 RepID=UPI003F7F9792